MGASNVLTYFFLAGLGLVAGGGVGLLPAALVFRWVRRRLL